MAIGFKDGEKDYKELLNVAFKQQPDFDLVKYKNAEEAEKEEMLRGAIVKTLKWMSKQFADGHSFEAALVKLNWKCS